MSAGGARVLPSGSTFVLRQYPWDALIRQLNLGTWADGEQVVQPTVPCTEVCRLYLFSLRRGHLLMRELTKGW